MNIDEAIRIKSLEGEEFLHTDVDDIDEADRLSIEALKLIQLNQELWGKCEAFLLPSQTED